jgi:CPA1 family monovalent cation:H+ antiporter
MKAVISSIQDQFNSSTIDEYIQNKEALGFRRQLSPGSSERFRARLRRMVADIDFLLAKPLGWREGTIVVWAGMRGVVTLAAAQTLPATMPDRSLLILIAFCVALGSLLLQGGTLPGLIHVLKPAGIDRKALEEEHTQLMRLLNSAAAEAIDESEPNEMIHRFREYLAHGDEEFSDKLQTLQQLRLAVLDAQRKALLDVRDHGEFSAEALSVALENLDADQISLDWPASGRHSDAASPGYPADTPPVAGSQASRHGDDSASFR